MSFEIAALNRILHFKSFVKKVILALIFCATSKERRELRLSRCTDSHNSRLDSSANVFVTTRNTTPARPCEGRFGYTWFVCDLKFQGWCSKSGPKSNTHRASYIADELTADHTDKLENGCQFSVNSKLQG